MPSEKLQHFTKVLDVLKESLTRKEFLDFSKALIKQVLEIEKQIAVRQNKAISELGNLGETLTSRTERDLEDIKREVVERLSKIRDGYTPQKNVDYFDGKDGEPGKNVDPKEVALAVLSQINLVGMEQELLGKVDMLRKEVTEIEKKLSDSITRVGQQRIVSGPNANAVQAYHFTQDGSKSYYAPTHRTPLALLRTEAPFMVTLNNGFSIVGRNLVIAENVTDTTGQEGVFLFIK